MRKISAKDMLHMMGVSREAYSEGYAQGYKDACEEIKKVKENYETQE